MTTTCPRCGEPLVRCGSWAFCESCGWETRLTRDILLAILGTAAGALLAWGAICAARAWGWL